jgi:hypothetical protein
MIHYLSPAGRDTFSGGVRKLYDHVDILKGAGMNARIVRSDVVDPVTLFPKDLIVVPEIYGDLLANLAPTVAKVSFNQNAYLSWTDVSDPERHPYLNTPSLLGVLCVSLDNKEFLESVFPELEVEHYRPWINVDDRFKFGPWPRDRKICYFARKRSEVSSVVLGALYARGRIDKTWEVVCLDGMTDEEIAEHLRTAAIFLSFSKLEGFGAPPVEAMISGCLVVGFAGLGGREFAQYFAAVAEDSISEYLYRLESMMTDVELGVSEYDIGKLKERSEELDNLYSRSSEEDSIIELMKGYSDRARSLLLP